MSVLLNNLAAQFREEVSELYLAGRRLAPSKKRLSAPSMDRDASYADRSRIRIMRVIGNLETYAELTRGNGFALENDDIVKLVSEICEGSADLAEYLGVELTFSCAEVSHVCAIHSEYIRQLTYHLLSNAMKSAPSGGRVVVRVQFRRPARRVLLSVEDNGHGIAPDRLAGLFDGVHDMTENPDTPHGAGLGLLICKRIAEGHGGFMAAESKPGKGSKFTLNIPDEMNKLITFRQPDFHVSNGGIHPSLIGLSDALPVEAFAIKNQM